MVRAGDRCSGSRPKPFQGRPRTGARQMAKDSRSSSAPNNDQKRYDALFALNAASSQQRDQADATAKSWSRPLRPTVPRSTWPRSISAIREIRSPIDGKTGPILIQPGNLVSANGSSPLVVLAQIQPVKVSFSLPQSDLPRIQSARAPHASVGDSSICTRRAGHGSRAPGRFRRQRGQRPDRNDRAARHLRQ